MRILVAIANYGCKNAQYLRRILDEYRTFSHDVNIVVLSDKPKDLGHDVEVRVGLPSRNPHSLPFAYKRLFLERQDQYDLFIYSEDDTLVTQRNVDAFIEVSSFVPEDKIVGFLRYEADVRGNYYSTIHTRYAWDPHSVCRFGPFTLAYYSNEHAACFMMTRKQLKLAIASGGFNRAAREYGYDMLVAAATCPYTNCGLRKMIPISHLKDFRLKHLSNKYIGLLGIREAELDLQIQALLSMDEEARSSLLHNDQIRWGHDSGKYYYEPCRADVIALIPPAARSVLSVGCVSGETEAAIARQGIRVVGIPMDSAIAALARGRGVELAPADHAEAMEFLSEQRFDCIIIVDVLEYAVDPVAWLRDYRMLLNPGGCVVVSLTNTASSRLLSWLHGYPVLPRLIDIWRGKAPRPMRRSGGVPHRWLRAANLQLDTYHWRLPPTRRVSFLRMLNFPRRWLADRFIARLVEPNLHHTAVLAQSESEGSRRNQLGLIKETT